MATTPFTHMPPPQLTDAAADEWTQGFWDAAATEQLVATKCSSCATFRLPPGRFCRNCGSQEFTFEPLPGTGTVFSYTVVRQAMKGVPAEHVPYMPAVIDPDGAAGIRFVSAIVDCEPDDVVPGMKVKVVWQKVDDKLTIPFWAPA
jgi:uncharacterized OB-fold protein